MVEAAVAPRLLFLLLALAAAAAAAGQAAGEEADALAAQLAADELCSQGGDGAEGDGGACALAALQMRGQKVAATRESGNQTRSRSGQIFGHPRPDASYPTFPGYTLMLVEEFDQPIDLDKDPIWTWSDGGLKEGDVRFVKEAIKFEGGKMIIEMSNTLKVPIQSCSNAEVAYLPGKPLTSGELRARHNMFRYGIYEVKMKAPFVQGQNPNINGNYVATMFIFRDAKYRHWREIDFEITGNRIDSLNTNVLYADNAPAWRAGIGEEMIHRLGTNIRAGFHEYRIEWLPNKVTWYFDGRKIREKSGGRVHVPEMSGKIMANLWTFQHNSPRFGGKEVGNNRYPMRSEYEWIRFYKWDGDQHYPCADMTASCLNDDDNYLTSNNGCDGIAQVGDVFGKPPPCIASCR